jgi:hypothetical protein
LAAHPKSTFVKDMSAPTDRSLKSPNIEATSRDLREGIDFSREIVRQSRVLIELSESDRPPVADNDDKPTAR